ncbi:hypothetical protein VTH8203_02510 [Vibrio thalassae]|uniref:Uncharacterized protein n=1 Tax=Vibrio thalassae TaxID=1243014 RepID=A0A240EKW6_9VIBR|nr:hypothetical protein VTH8203_02510 [Vibrio thalassae]
MFYPQSGWVIIVQYELIEVEKLRTGIKKAAKAAYG